MADYYKVLTASPLGEPWTPNFPDAKPLQSYWCQFENVDKDVKITKQVPNVVSPGDQVYGDLAYAKSQKGNEYWQFKSQKTPDGQPRATSAPQATAQAATGQSTGHNMSALIPDWFMPYGRQIEFIYLAMKALEDTPSEPLATPLTQTSVLTLADDVEPLSAETEKLMNEVFGVEEIPTDMPDATDTTK